MCLAGDLVGDEDIESSPTFELIVESGDAEEVELQHHVDSDRMTAASTTISSSSSSAAAEAVAIEMQTVTAFSNKRLKLHDVHAVNIPQAVSDGLATTAVFSSGMCDNNNC